ncbi:MAG: peptide deformylase [Microgenomates group bacterium Gr01-1014_16]|nr:MAG: peptide deformylase [Microgenomates group bacterium Gr01-1014_16]
MIKTIKAKTIGFKKILDEFPEVRYAGDPVLRQVAKTVSLQEGIKLSEKLGDVLMRFRKAAGYGRGFAAPQIGENKAVFVTFVDDQLQTFINPKIIERSRETNYYRELCLSSGIMAADTERSEWIVMEWMDVSGKKRREKVEGFLARLYQHEEAHLRGKLNLDEAVDGGIEFAIFDPLKEQLRKSRN